MKDNMAAIKFNNQNTFIDIGKILILRAVI